MRRVLTGASIALVALTGCSALFSDSEYTGGTRPDAGHRDAGGRDAVVPDAPGPSDGGGTDTGGADAPMLDGGPPTPLPTCGDGFWQSPDPRDVRGNPVGISTDLHQALFGEGAPTAGEVGIRGDLEVPGLPADTIDVALGRTNSGAMLAAANATGEVVVRPVYVATDLELGMPVAIDWAGRPPTTIRRIAMRSIEGEMVLAIAGDRAAEPEIRGWLCTVAGTVACTQVITDNMMGHEALTVGIGASPGGLEPIFLGRTAVQALGCRTTEASALSPFGVPLADRVSGSHGRLLVATDFDGDDPVGLAIAASGINIVDFGGEVGPAAAAAFSFSEHLLVQGLDHASDFDLEARVVACDPAGCGCPGEPVSGDCRLTDGRRRHTSPEGHVLFVEAEAYGSAALAVAGLSGEMPGTEVVLYAFRRDATPIPASADGPRILLGSGMGGTIVGTLVPDRGMRTTLVSGVEEATLVEVALVDLVGAGAPTRRAYLSALKVCARQ